MVTIHNRDSELQRANKLAGVCRMIPGVQEEQAGCGIAAVANILNMTYPEMKQVVNPLGIYATDKALWSDTHYEKTLL